MSFTLIEIAEIAHAVTRPMTPRKSSFIEPMANISAASMRVPITRRRTCRRKVVAQPAHAQS